MQRWWWTLQTEVVRARQLSSSRGLKKDGLVEVSLPVSCRWQGMEAVVPITAFHQRMGPQELDCRAMEWSCGASGFWLPVPTIRSGRDSGSLGWPTHSPRPPPVSSFSLHLLPPMQARLTCPVRALPDSCWACHSSQNRLLTCVWDFGAVWNDGIQDPSCYPGGTL